MKPKLVYLGSVCILALFLCLCSKSIAVEVLDYDKELLSEGLEFHAPIIFSYPAIYSNWFSIAFALPFIPQHFIIQYIAKYEKSPPG